MDDIQPRNFQNPELQHAEREAMRAAREHTSELLQQYAARPDTFNGRYVAADTMKELLPGYSQSPESRNALNGAVHNSAAVLSAEQFRRIVDAGPQGKSDTAVFITGIPGAGKSSAVNLYAGEKAAVVFEGQMSRPDAAMQKIEHALQKGFDVQIVAVHVPPELALDRTHSRFTDPTNGRGASLAVMSEIQGHLPAGLEKIQERFGDRVHLMVVDSTPNAERMVRGWPESIQHLKKEGSYEQVTERLNKALDRGYSDGRYNDDFYRQAAGREPSAVLAGGRREQVDRGLQTNEQRPSVSSGNQKENAVSAYAKGKANVQNSAALGPTKQSSAATPTTTKQPTQTPAAAPDAKRGRGR